MTDEDRFAYGCMRLGSQMRGFASGLEKGDKNAFLIALLNEGADHLLHCWNQYARDRDLHQIPKEENG